jgi:hypothetical protein
MAKVAIDAGSLDEARASLTAALPLARATGNALTLGEAEAGLGVVCALEGALDDARAHFDRARASASPGPRGIDLVDLLRGHLDVAEARAHFDGGDTDAMNERLRTASARLREATTGGNLRFRERRLAVASLNRAIDDAASWGAPSRPTGDDTSSDRADTTPVLFVFLSRRSMTTPEGRQVELEKHPALWRIIAFLVEVHTRTPGQAVAVAELVSAGWPDERVRPEPGARRVYTALSTLRRRGLRAWIVKREDGYCLEPQLRAVTEP